MQQRHACHSYPHCWYCLTRWVWLVPCPPGFRVWVAPIRGGQWRYAILRRDESIVSPFMPGSEPYDPSHEPE